MSEITNKEILSLSKQEKNNIGLPKDEYDKRIAYWQMFYLNNLDLFIIDVLGIKLKYFQRQLVLEMWDSETFTFIASRGLGKSFIIAIVLLALCLLLPNYKATIVSMTIGQSNLIISEKIDKLLTTANGMSKTLYQLRKEEYIKLSKDRDTGGLSVELANGSSIVAGAVLESLRGRRSHCLVTDECCLIKKKDYDSIAEPLLQPYEYKGLFLEPKQFFLTSPRDKSNWMWNYLRKTVHDHYKGKKERKFFASDIYCAVANHIQTAKQFYMRRDNTDPFSWSTEYLCLWQGEKEDSLFKRKDFNDAQVNKCTYYPTTLYKNKILEDKKENEIRIVTVDIAVSSGEQNDNTIIICGSLNTDTGIRKTEYVTSRNGLNSLQQVILFKRLFYDYDADYFCMDSKGVGNVLYDIMTTPTRDEEFGKTYPAWTVNQDKSLQISSDTVVSDKIDRTIDSDARSVIIPIAGTSELNSEFHYTLWTTLRNKKLELLRDMHEIEMILQDEDPRFVMLDSEERAEILIPYKEIDLTINETMSLDIIRNDRGLIAVKEQGTATKDRYMDLAYFNYFCEKLYNKHIGNSFNEEFDIEDFDEIYRY